MALKFFYISLGFPLEGKYDNNAQKEHIPLPHTHKTHTNTKRGKTPRAHKGSTLWNTSGVEEKYELSLPVTVQGHVALHT